MHVKKYHLLGGRVEVSINCEYIFFHILQTEKPYLEKS